MKPAPFTYHDPRTIQEVAGLLSQHENSRVLAGGQSLMPMMNFRLVQLDHLIDLNNVADLFGVRDDGDGRVRFGAMTRQRSLKLSEELAASFPIIREALGHVGHRQTRARGTIGGSLCHFDPSAELCNLAALHDAEFVLVRDGGERRLSFIDFGLSYLTTAIEPDEFLRELSFARWPSRHGHGFEEFAMRHGDFAICAASCLMTLSDDGDVDRIAVVLSGVSAAPLRLTEAEKAARGCPVSEDLFRAIAFAASKVEAMSDVYVSAEYRSHLARVMTYRAVAAAARRAQRKAET